MAEAWFLEVVVEAICYLTLEATVDPNDWVHDIKLPSSLQDNS